MSIYTKINSKEATASDAKKQSGAPLNTIWVNGTIEYCYAINLNQKTLILVILFKIKCFCVIYFINNYI